MKRGAERQLTRNSGHSDGEDDDAPKFGIQVADSETLARRPMKAMPKRFGGGTPTPSMSVDPKPSAFKFGEPSSTGASTAFTFSAPSPTTPAKTPSPFSSAAKPASSPLFTSTPVAASASSATKTFASYLDSSSHAKQINSSTTSKKAYKSPLDQFYSCIRGLNLSAITAVKTAVEKDPFTDLSQVFEQYKSVRSLVLKDYDESRMRSTPSQPSTSPASLFGTTSAQGIKPAKPFEMPKPPQSLSFGASSSNVSNSNSSPSTSTTTNKPSGFAFPTSPANTDSVTKPGGFTFTPKPTSSTSPSEQTGSVFGGSIFGKQPSQTTATGAPKSFFGSTSSPAASNIFGGTSASPAGNVFGGAAASRAGSVFGGTSASPAGGVFSNSSNSPSTTVFGSSASSGAATAGAVSLVSKPANLGTSVGFPFGAPKADDGTSSQAVALFQPSSSGSSVAVTKPENPPTALVKTLSPPPSEGSRGLTPMTEGEGDDGASKVLGANPHDEEGEGEEDEETVHKSRVKVYKMVQKDGQPQWADFGVGFLRLKKHKSSEARRMLSRNSANGKVMLNFNIYSSLNVTRNKNVLSFIGHEDGKKATFRVKVKDEAGASALKQAIDNEAAAVKSRESSVA